MDGLFFSADEFFVEHNHGKDETDERDYLADTLLGDLLREMGAQVITGQSPDSHEAHFRPVNQAFPNEPYGGHEVDQRAQDSFNRVHLVYIAKAK